jgi:hypothetical protein
MDDLDRILAEIERYRGIAVPWSVVYGLILEVKKLQSNYRKIVDTGRCYSSACNHDHRKEVR